MKANPVRDEHAKKFNYNFDAIFDGHRRRAAGKLAV